ncbi:MAG: prepilin-type N-terminal cleavage/methylation domain-containing protein [Bacilli bacterium]|nr:prepilin-type N-terminal cleavage/methylation domain-containing protein [Bacilli bacterium]
MNKRGFTLIELLTIIVLITIITLIAVPSIKYAQNKINNKNYETKKSLIKTAAEEYGEDNREYILYQSTQTYVEPSSGRSYPSMNDVTVSTLLQNGYLVKDNGLTVDDIKDPRNDTSLLTKTITIYIKNGVVYAVLNNFD